MIRDLSWLILGGFWPKYATDMYLRNLEIILICGNGACRVSFKTVYSLWPFLCCWKVGVFLKTMRLGPLSKLGPSGQKLGSYCSCKGFWDTRKVPVGEKWSYISCQCCTQQKQGQHVCKADAGEPMCFILSKDVHFTVMNEPAIYTVEQHLVICI